MEKKVLDHLSQTPMRFNRINHNGTKWMENITLIEPNVFIL